MFNLNSDMSVICSEFYNKRVCELIHQMYFNTEKCAFMIKVFLVLK